MTPSLSASLLCQFVRRVHGLRTNGPRGLVVVNRLGLCPRVIEEENGDLLVRLLTHIDAAVNPVRRLIPVRLPSRDVKAVALATIALFDGECIAA
jgi:hypothetical protein